MSFVFTRTGAKGCYSRLPDTQSPSWKKVHAVNAGPAEGTPRRRLLDRRTAQIHFPPPDRNRAPVTPLRSLTAIGS